MGIMDKVNQVVGGGSGVRSVQLTTTGDDKLQKVHAAGAEYLILSAVKRHEPCTLSEVSRDPQLVKFGIDDIRTTIMAMLDKGWLMYAPIGGR